MPKKHPKEVQPAAHSVDKKKALLNFIPQLKKKLRAIPHAKQIMIAVTSFGAMLLGIGLLFFVVEKSKDNYVLRFDPEMSGDEKMKVRSEIQKTIQIERKAAAFGIQYESHPFLVVALDDKQVEKKQLDFGQEAVINYPILVDLKDLSDGEHTIAVAIVDEKDENSSLGNIEFKVEKDSTAPTVTEVNILEGKSAKVSLNDAKKIAISDVKANEAKISIQLSEKATFNLDKPVSDIVKTETAEDQALSVTIPANQKPFTTKYHLIDEVGLETDGVLSYYYDNVPPTISINSPAVLYTNETRSINLAIESNESLSKASAKLSGKDYSAKKISGNSYSTESIPLELGTNTILITAVDLSGNVTTKEFPVTLREPIVIPTRSPVVVHHGCSAEQYNACDEKIGGYENICAHKDEWLSCLSSCGTQGIVNCP